MGMGRAGKGFMGFVKKHLDAGVLGTIAFGFALPTMASYIWSQAGSRLQEMPLVGTVLANPVGRAGVGTLLTAGIVYGAMKANVINGQTALLANSVALTMFAIGALKTYTSNSVVQALPGASLNGFSGYLGGYRGGYLGYLGSEHAGMGEAEMLPAPVNDQLFGMGSAPQVNVF